MYNHTAFVRHCLGADDLNIRRMRAAHKRLFRMHTKEFMAMVQNLRTAVQMAGADEELIARAERIALACEECMVDDTLEENRRKSHQPEGEGVAGRVRRSTISLWHSISGK
jgi:hypothetical protein